MPQFIIIKNPKGYYYYYYHHYLIDIIQQNQPYFTTVWRKNKKNIDQKKKLCECIINIIHTHTNDDVDDNDDHKI